MKPFKKGMLVRIEAQNFQPGPYDNIGRIAVVLTVLDAEMVSLTNVPGDVELNGAYTVYGVGAKCRMFYKRDLQQLNDGITALFGADTGGGQ